MVLLLLLFVCSTFTNHAPVLLQKAPIICLDGMTLWNYYICFLVPIPSFVLRWTGSSGPPWASFGTVLIEEIVCCVKLWGVHHWLFLYHREFVICIQKYSFLPKREIHPCFIKVRDSSGCRCFLKKMSTLPFTNLLGCFVYHRTLCLFSSALSWNPTAPRGLYGRRFYVRFHILQLSFRCSRWWSMFLCSFGFRMGRGGPSCTWVRDSWCLDLRKNHLTEIIINPTLPYI